MAFNFFDRQPKTSVDEDVKKQAYYRYVDDTVFRFRWISLVIAIAQFIMIFLDLKAGFFAADPINYLNLAAEIMLVVSSAIIFVLCRKITRNSKTETKLKTRMIVGYRIVIMLAILFYIFTDIYVRKEAIGTYMIFLFVLQITPAYVSRVNWIQFTVIGLFTCITYFLCAGKSYNTLFGTVFIYIAFAISTNFLRGYFVRQLENYYLAKKTYSRFQNLSEQTITALSNAVEAKDLYTNGHSQRVANYSEELARRMGYSAERCQEVYFIGLMHDVGKIGVPDTIINKTDRLTDEEFAEIKKHPAKGYEILRQITEMPGIGEGARWHHERIDGRGYPDGLKGDEIPEIAKIIAVADAYDAMTSNRSYRALMPQERVRQQFVENSGTQFDPAIAEIMIKMIDEDMSYNMHQ